MNPFKNEKVIKLGGVEILLRPDFENMAALEEAVGSMAYLGYRFSRGARIKGQGGSLEEIVKAMPTMTECAQIIYYSQAARNETDATKRKFSLEEIWSLVQEEGIAITTPVGEFINNMGQGTKNLNPQSVSEKKPEPEGENEKK